MHIKRKIQSQKIETWQHAKEYSYPTLHSFLKYIHDNKEKHLYMSEMTKTCCIFNLQLLETACREKTLNKINLIWITKSYHKSIENGVYLWTIKMFFPKTWLTHEMIKIYTKPLFIKFSEICTCEQKKIIYRHASITWICTKKRNR